MKVLVCIDDTDNLESKGTGELASEISAAIRSFSWGECQPVSRHQLFVHEAIPYTSHNSAMCFSTELQDENLGRLIEFAANYLARESAEGSDPGLCVVPVRSVVNTEPLDFFWSAGKKRTLDQGGSISDRSTARDSSVRTWRNW